MPRFFVVLLIVPLAIAGCGRHRVATQPEVPLAMPTPPPHVVTPPQPEETAEPAKPNEPQQRRNTRPPARTEPPKVEPPRTQQPSKPETPPAAPKEEPPPQQPTTLQTPTQAELDKQARALLTQADKDLRRVNYGSLTSDAKGQYETARRFIEQAQQALKEQNFVMAQKLADKAATIAAVLVGR